MTIIVLYTIFSFYDKSKTQELNKLKEEKEVLMDSLATREVTIYRLKKKYDKIRLGLRDDVVVKLPDRAERDTYIWEQIARREAKR